MVEVVDIADDQPPRRQMRRTTTTNPGVWIGGADPDDLGWRVEDGLRARRCAAGMVARLQRHHHEMDSVCDARLYAGLNGGGLGVERSRFLVSLASKHRATLIQHEAADRWVRGGSAGERFAGRQRLAEGFRNRGGWRDRAGVARNGVRNSHAVALGPGSRVGQAKPKYRTLTFHMSDT